jgi:diguanylate cyclase (GGDEF)-like protein/PAS domain S-box-containing protein
MNALIDYFASTGFMPHGHCFLWTPTLLWTYVVSDSLIGVAYYSIPVALWYFARRRPDLPFPWVFLMFALFIFACGTTHLMAIWNIWQPVYWLDAGVKMATAAASVATAISLWPLIPKALSLSSPRQLEESNRRLQNEIIERRQIERELQDLNRLLEHRVAERTAELQTTNGELRRQMDERKQVERSLLESQQLLQAVVDNSTAIIWAKDLDGRYLLINGSYEKLFDLRREDIIGKTDYDLFPKEQAEVFRAVDQKALAAESAVQAEEVALQGNKPTIYFSVKCPLRDERGKPYALCGISTDITERKRAEQERSTLAAIVESSEDAIISVKLDGTIESWNRGAEKVYGYSAGEIKGRHLSILVASDRRDEPSEILERIRQGESVSDYETVRVRKGGHRINISLTMSPVKDAAGRIIGASGIGRDLTERKRLEARFHATVESAPTAMVMIDSAGLIVLVNAETERLFGYARQVLLGQSVEMLVPERFRAQHPQLRSHFFAAPEAKRMGAGRDLFGLRKDGSEFPVEIGLNPIETEEGQFVLSAIVDITERKQAEEELRIAAITFQTQEGIMITDRGANIQRVNRAFTELTGYGAEEAVGRTPALLKSGRHDRQFYQGIWDALGRENYWQGELWNRRKTGEVYPVWMTISAVLASDGRVTHYVGSFADITQQKEAEAKLHRLAYYDPLTELPNRRLLLERLRQAFAASARSRQHGAILFIDLDHFKTLNDTKGHDVGDQLLTQVAVRLRSCMRGDDSIARLGGDEFVVMLEDLSKHEGTAAMQAEAVAEKIRAAISQPYSLGGHEHHSTPSIGVSLFFDHTQTTDEVLRRADVALYRAKAAGRNTLRFFDPSMQAALETHAALEEELRHALLLEQLKPYLQVQMDSNRRIIGAEVLLRWEHPERGLISPADFIPLAEESGLIVPIGLWVLETACAKLKAWAARPLTRELRLAVNVSARQFRQPDFVMRLRRVLELTGADPTRLTLELTESLVLDNVEYTIEIMQALKSLGLGFSLDDFGTGYSSLSYLRRLPLDQLKIDRSFVLDLLTEPNDAVIVQTIIGMAKNLGLDVLAEGVETEEQLAFLSRHGCLAFQGSLFSAPLPVADFEQLLTQQGSWGPRLPAVG